MTTNHLSERDVEGRTREYGKDVFARLDGTARIPFSSGWFDDRLMEWTMSNEAVKVQLFRFIDVLPLLRTPDEVTRHLREYFAEAGASLPGWMRFGLRWMPQNGWAGRMLAKQARTNAERLARRFIAGNDAAETLEAIAALRRQNLAFTVDLLGEATVTETESEEYQRYYLDLIEGMCGPINSWAEVPQIDGDHQGPLPRCNFSIKFSSLFSQFDPIDPVGTSRVVRDRLRPILHAARRQHAFVNIDMEQYAFKDLTLRILREILEERDFRDWTDVGIALQAYLRDTEADLRDLANWVERRGAPIWVRLIKGAYWDYETVIADQMDWPAPVFTQKWETDANYEKLTRFLLERYTVLRPAFGSHNIRSLAHVLATAELLDLPPRSFELQMLYGMAGSLQDAFVGLGQRVRIYTPVGQLLPGMAYLVRRLLENTANDSFLRASQTDHVPEEQLLMNPAHHSNHSTGAAEGKAGTSDRFHNEPLNDFSKDEVRRAMQKAVDDVKGQLGRTYPPIVNHQPLTTERFFESLNPSHSRQVVGRCGSASTAQAEQAVAVAKAVFPAWRDLGPHRRADFFFKAAEIMRRRRFELAAWQVHECGKQWREADADVAESIDFCDYYARETLRLANPQRRDVPGEDNEYFYEPRGVVVVIAPWNFPMAILCGMSVAALVTGNSVIMKPAEPSAVVGAKLMEVFQQAGLPPGVANYLPGVGREIGPVLTKHPDVSLIIFTGSLNVGLMINRQAAETPGHEHVKRVIAEMGGKNAVIIDEDADLDEAVRGVVSSAFGYQGQKCSACSRAIVLDSIHDHFLNRLVEATRSLKVGPAEDPSAFVGPVIDEKARQGILEYIAQGKKEATLAYAADLGNLADEGYYIPPHIFSNVSPDAVIAQEEIFGPVLAVIKARDLTHALEIANGTRYALTGGLYSRSPESIARVRREFRVGNLYINRKITGALVDRQPFGGFKLSGIGSKAGGPDYLLQFVNPRTITENTMRRGFAPTGEPSLK